MIRTQLHIKTKRKQRINEQQRVFQAKNVLLLLVLLTFSSLLFSEDASVAANKYDWVEKSKLSPTQQEKVLPGCNGRYVDPLKLSSSEQTTALSLGGTTLANEPLVVEADESTLHQGTTAILRGDVQISQGSRSLAAQSMIYNRENEEAVLKGDVTIRQQGLLIRGELAEISTIKNQAKFEDASFVLHESHLRGSAGAIKQENASTVVLENGEFTSCEPGSETWKLQGERITIDNEKHQGVGKNVKLKIGNVPVLYFPYVTFPVGDQRQSGFLSPELNPSEKSGMDIAFPYYWNIAPNYDATLIPRLIAGRGAMFEAEGRRLSKRFYSELNVAVLPSDDGGQDKDLEIAQDNGLTEAQLKPHKGKDRWLFSFQQEGSYNSALDNQSASGWYSKIHYAKVSDIDYFRDLGTSSFSANNKSYLEQSLEIGYLLNNWHLRVLAQNYQTLLEDLESPYRRVPQIDLNGQYRWGQLGASLKHQYTHFDNKAEMLSDSTPIVTGARMYTDYRLFSDHRQSWGFIKPEIGLKSLHYRLDEAFLLDAQEKQITLSAGQFSLDTGLTFVRDVGGISQTLEPRIFYLYRGHADHSDLFNVAGEGVDVDFDTSQRTFSYNQLYRDSRFNGFDRLDDANQLTIGATTRWYGSHSANEILTLSVGQIIHFDDRHISLTSPLETEDESEFAADLAISINNQTRLYTSATYNTGVKELTRATAGIHFHSNDYQKLANISYSAVQPDDVDVGLPEIDQIDGSFVWPVKRGWHLLGRYHYDFTSAKELESFIGFEYNDCCYRIRVLARRWLDSNIAKLDNLVDTDGLEYDKGLFFELQLKGLGGSGGNTNTLLSDSIPGFEERERVFN